jgi:hypothetical protein
MMIVFDSVVDRHSEAADLNLTVVGFVVEESYSLALNWAD